MKNILLVDDHELIKRAIYHYLENNADYHIVDEAPNGQEACRLVKKKSIDIVVTDLSMPIMDGFELVENLHLNFPQVKVIVLSMNDDVSEIEKVLRLGARGYLSKDITKENFIKALDKVSAGKLCIDPKFIAALKKTRSRRQSNSNSFSSIDKKVLLLLIDELGSNEISDQLNIPVIAVKKIENNLLKKSNCDNMPGVIVYAIENGII